MNMLALAALPIAMNAMTLLILTNIIAMMALSASFAKSASKIKG